MSARLAAAALALLASASLAAQDDPLFDGADEASVSAWTWYGDLLLRGDSVENLPARDDVGRLRGRARAGVRWNDADLEFGLALEGALGSDANADNRRNNDNERSDDVNLDELYLRRTFGERGALLVGKTLLPLALSPMTWDEDLRPIGASVDWSVATGDFDRVQFVLGGFAGDHLYGDDSRILAAQAAWRLREGAPTSGEIVLGFLHFDDLEDLTLQGLARTNRRRAGVPGQPLLSDYRLVDLQFGLRTLLGDWPLDARLDLVRNLGADDQRDGARASLVLGDSREAGGWEFGFAAERIQRDAVMAAFNSDDWWFHSAFRGVMPWIAYGIDDRWRVQLAGFRERRDGLDEHVERVLLDLGAVW